MSLQLIKEAILIRTVEEKLLSLFSEGKLNGTVHTCIGQEFSAVSIVNNLDNNDFVFSNHRGHGHYISKTKDIKGLIAEVMGKKSGACRGVGGSQHLHHKNYYSNGIQGSIVPVSAGIAYANKLKINKSIGLVYIGDGTFGEGVLYETFNIISLLEIPLLIVCEDNGISQSTKQSNNLSGSIIKRVESFGIKSYLANTNEYLNLSKISKKAISYVRNQSKPAFIHLKTNRLKAHSKGDDTRPSDEIKKLELVDPINIFEKHDNKIYNQIKQQCISKVQLIVDELSNENSIGIKDYLFDYNKENNNQVEEWKELKSLKGDRFVNVYNESLIEIFRNHKNAFMIGEDILSPYGGAFKVTKDLSKIYPDRVFSTPISEHAITGLGVGMSMNGFRPFVEIMFGDFSTLIIDQIINSAVKFNKMFNNIVNCPLVIRTPMGGYRGYGPTHSQTLDKLFIGIDDLVVIALNILTHPQKVLNRIMSQNKPVFLIENKTDYSKFFNDFNLKSHKLFELDNGNFPITYLKSNENASLTIVCYGGMVSLAIDVVRELFIDFEIISEIIVPTKINSENYKEIYPIVESSKNLLIIEEGSIKSGFGVNLVSELKCNDIDFKSSIFGAIPVPIPSNKELENYVLPNKDSIIRHILKNYNYEG